MQSKSHRVIAGSLRIISLIPSQQKCIPIGERRVAKHHRSVWHWRPGPHRQQPLPEPAKWGNNGLATWPLFLFFYQYVLVSCFRRFREAYNYEAAAAADQ